MDRVTDDHEHTSPSTQLRAVAVVGFAGRCYRFFIPLGGRSGPHLSSGVIDV